MLGFQGKYQSLDDFMQFLLAKCDTIKACGGYPGLHMGLYVIAVTKEKEAVGVGTSDFSAWDEKERQEILKIAKKASCQRYLACLFLKQSNDSHYRKFKIKFANNNIAGTTLYVNSLEEILLIINTYKKIGSGGIGNRKNNAAAPNESGMVFTQERENGRDVNKTNLHC